MKVGAVELTTGATSDTIRLQANVCYQDGSREQIWFDFPERLSSSVSLTADPWIVALAPISMLLGEPLETELTADSRLVCGLHRVAKIWRYWFPALSPLQLVVTSEEREGSRSGSTASLFSGGIDSWYTVLRNADDAAKGIPPALDSLLFIWGADVRLDRPDVLEPDHALAVDNERLGDSDRAERKLRIAVRVRSNAHVRIAVALKESGDSSGRVPDGDTIDLRALAAQFLEHGRFRDAGDAPASEQVEQARFPGRKLGRA